MMGPGSTVVENGPNVPIRGMSRTTPTGTSRIQMRRLNEFP